MRLLKTQAVLGSGMILLCTFLSTFNSVYSQNESEGIQIFLRNETSAETEDRTNDRSYDIIIPIITALGAIGGAILGTYFTGRHALNLEKERIKEQRRIQNEINRRVKRMVHVELGGFSKSFGLIAESGEVSHDGKYSELEKAVVKTLMTLESHYLAIPIEMKVSAFSPEALETIEKAYHAASGDKQFFNEIYPKYERGEMTKKELLEVYNPTPTKEFFDKAKETLEKELNL